MVSSQNMPKFSIVLNNFAEILKSQTFKFAEILSTFSPNLYLLLPYYLQSGETLRYVPRPSA